MSLNNSHAGKDGIVLFNMERVLVFYDGVQMTFDDTKDEHFKGKKSGRIFLTTHRVILLNSSKKDKLLSLSMPFYTLKSLDLEQPVFGANYITGKINAEQNGGWSGSAKFKMYFNKGGAIEFGKAMMQAGKLASQNGPQQPPPYSHPANLPYYQAPPPAYTPPQGHMYGFVPVQTFPDQPPPGTVFMYNVPPPYPGVDPNLTPFNIQTGPHQAMNPSPFNMNSGAAGPPPPYAPAGLPEAPNGDVPGAHGSNNSAFNGYPSPQQPGYPSQQPGYPPQQPGYPPQQPGYPPQQPGYPPQQPGYPPQQPGYPNNFPSAPSDYPQAYPNQPPQAPFTAAFNQQQPYNPQAPYPDSRPQPPMSAAAAKEAEAMASGAGAVGGYGGQAYFDPNNPGSVYLPTYQPPSYQPPDKKND